MPCTFDLTSSPLLPIAGQIWASSCRGTGSKPCAKVTCTALSILDNKLTIISPSTKLHYTDHAPFSGRNCRCMLTSRRSLSDDRRRVDYRQATAIFCEVLILRHSCREQKAVIPDGTGFTVKAFPDRSYMTQGLSKRGT